ADVQNHLIAAHAVHRDHARRRVGRERFGNHGVHRQYQLAAFGLRLGHDLARGRQEIALAQPFFPPNVRTRPERYWPCSRRLSVATFASRLPSRSSLVDTSAPTTIAASGRTGICNLSRAPRAPPWPQNRSSRNGTAKIISRPTCHHEPLDG